MKETAKWEKDYQYIKEFSLIMISGCKVKTDSGISIFTPDGVSSYNGLWLRDFSYMVEYSGVHIEEREIVDCIEYAIEHRRSDGWMPDRVYGDGTTAYAAGEVGHPIGEANLDNTPFLIFIIHSLYLRMEETLFVDLFIKWRRHLEKGLQIIPLSESGMVYNSSEKPHSPYGFTDTVCKTGELFLETILYWRACLFMEEMNVQLRLPGGVSYYGIMKRIETAIDVLYESSSGAFYAATESCREIDIWGMIYSLYIDYPYKKDQKGQMLSFLKVHAEDYLYEGQVRHLLKNEYWEKLLIDIKPEEYQNGAYWATATGWAVWCLFQSDRKQAAVTLKRAIQYFQTYGSFECVNDGYVKCANFVVSVTNVLGVMDRLSGDCDFIDLYENTEI